MTAIALKPGVSRPTLEAAPRDFAASIVVFLVAMPLCMGIAIASGVPPEKGLITGIIGGIVVGSLAGSPLQVSGPAAGLAVLVFELVRDLGVSALGPILILAGAIQLLAGVMKVGGWFRAISPAVVHGMLAGIGVLIVVGQFHVMFDAQPLPNGLANLAAMPGRLLGLSASDIGATEFAFLIAVLTIVAMLGWEKIRPLKLKLLPGALVGVLVGTLLAFVFALPVARVEVPSNILNAIAPPTDLLGSWMNPAYLVAGVAIAFIASAETLLSAAAVDKMHNGVRTDYNKELRGQGIGNLLCGAAGSLPMTGVIVRSSANVQAGAATRASTIMHGVWILGFVALLPFILREIPMATLAAVLVVTGYRLVSVGHVKSLYKSYGILPALIWAVTLTVVVAQDLLTGVLLGIALSMVEVVPYLRRLKLRIDASRAGEANAINLYGVASFVTLPRLSAALDDTPPDKPVVLDLTGLEAIDHTSAEMVRDWCRRRTTGGGEVSITGANPKLPALSA